MRRWKSLLPAVVEIFGLIFGSIALLIGWMGYGGYVFGVPAIIIGECFRRKHGGIIPLLTIIFGAVGIAESFVVMQIVFPTVEKTLNETAESINKTVENFTESLKKELGIKEERIQLPYIIEEDGRKLRINFIKVREADFVADNISYFEPRYKVYFPREGFKFVIIEYELENIGGKKISWIDLPAPVELMTDANMSYETLNFFEMTEGRGWYSIESNESKYVNYLCTPNVLDYLYPGEKILFCKFFEIRENENPEMVKFQQWLSTYYYPVVRYERLESGDIS